MSENLSKDQQEAYDRIINGENLFLTGKAGTGKSFVVKEIIKELNKRKKNIAILATTGISAMNIGGQTLHSFFSLPVTDICSFDKCFYVKKEKRKMWDATEIIIIDEVSMLRPDIFDAIHWTLIKNGCQSLYKKQIVLIGDLKQLPPVLRDDSIEKFYEAYEDHSFISAKILDKINIEELELSTIHRQNDMEFINNLNILRDGGKSKYFEQFVTKKTKGIILAPHVSTAANYNKVELAKIKNKSYFFNYNIELLDKTAKLNVDDFNIEKKLELKDGCKIMYLVNNDSLVNGSIGKLKILNDGKDLYFVSSDGKEHRINKHCFEKNVYVLNKNGRLSLKTVGRVYQYPIKLAYAMTIHKCQGLTFDEITIDLTKRTFAKGQLYTAFSRVREPKGLNIII